MNTIVNDIQSEAFSSIDLVHQCLIDIDKAQGFKAVIESAIQPNSSVLEFGTGSGILSLFAAHAGAESVTAVEFDPYIANVARENVQRNGKEDVITVITADARSIRFPPGKQFDIIIMEMINTGLVEEMQVQAINNLHNQNLITPTTTLIPSCQESFITLAQTNFTNHGFNMKMVKHIWSFMEPDLVLLSDRYLLNRIDFSCPIPETFSTQLQFEIQHSGILNSIVLSGKTIIDKERPVAIGCTWSMNPDIIIPLEEKEVSVGDTVTISFEYTFGGGFQNFFVEIIQ